MDWHSQKHGREKLHTVPQENQVVDKEFSPDKSTPS